MAPAPACSDAGSCDRLEVGDDGHCSRIAAGAESAKRGLAAMGAVDDHHVLAALGAGERRRQRHQHRLNGGSDVRPAVHRLRPRHLAYRAPEPLRVGEVHRLDRPNRPQRDGRRRRCVDRDRLSRESSAWPARLRRRRPPSGPPPRSRAPGLPAAPRRTRRGRLPSASTCSCRCRSAPRAPAAAGRRPDLPAPPGRWECLRRPPLRTAGGARGRRQPAAARHPAWAMTCLFAVTTDLPASSALRNPGAGRFEAADDLDHDVGVGAQDVFVVGRPGDGRRYPVDDLALDTPVADVRENQRAMPSRAQDARHRSPDRSESDQGDSDQGNLRRSEKRPSSCLRMMAPGSLQCAGCVIRSAIARRAARVRSAMVDGQPVGMALTFHMMVRWARDNRSLYSVLLGAVNRRPGRLCPASCRERAQDGDG